MEYAIIYTKEMKQSKNELLELNQIWLYKKAIIPGELVGMNGRQTTPCFQIIDEPSQIQWKIKQPTVLKPREKNIIN